MFYRKNRRKGFTLLELMIVVIIIGILASLAIPRFIEATKRARKSTAIQMLSTIRGSQLRYYAEFNEYTTVITNLDVSMTASTAWTLDAPDLTVGSGDDQQIAKVTHLTTNTVYTMEVDGDVATPAPTP